MSYVYIFPTSKDIKEIKEAIVRVEQRLGDTNARVYRLERVCLS